MSTSIYMISGLGADRRAFQYLDLSPYDVHHIEYLRPQENESLVHYATRLAEQIETPNPVLVGLSFGGVMSIEIAKQIETKQVVLISSVKGKGELPFYFKTAGASGLDKLLPFNKLMQLDWLINTFFNAKTKEEKELLGAFINDADPIFINWAIQQLNRWENTFRPENLSHIHGDRDTVLPMAWVEPDHVIKGGGHLMLISRAEEVSAWLHQIIQ